jgi:hypothetical protein
LLLIMSLAFAFQPFVEHSLTFVLHAQALLAQKQ